MELPSFDSGGLAERARLAQSHGRPDALVDQLSQRKPEEAAEMLESLFSTLLVKEMRKASGGEVFGKGPGSDVFEGWFDQHVGEALASQEALGLAGMIRAALDGRAAEPAGDAGETGKEPQE